MSDQHKGELSNDKPPNAEERDFLIDNKKKSFRHTYMRWVALCFACLLLLCDTSMDIPQALQVPLMESNMKLTAVQYNMLYSIYSIPNIFFPFLGGFIIDKLGVRVGVLIFSSICGIGQFVFMLGGVHEKFWLLLMGRVFFSLGNECNIVAQNTFVSSWFHDKELAFALSLSIGFTNVGLSVLSTLTPYLYTTTEGFFAPLFFNFILCVVAWLSGWILVWMDKESDRREGRLIEKKLTTGEDDESGDVGEEDVHIEEQEEEPQEEIKLKHIKEFSKKLWVLLVINMFLNSSHFTVLGNANDMLVTLFKIEYDKAGLYLMCVFLQIAIVCPLFGKLSDMYGHRANLMMLSCIIFVLGHLIIVLLPIDSSPAAICAPLIMIGLFFSLFSAVYWPCIPMVVDKNKVGTAFGIVTAIQNLNGVLSPLIFGSITDSTKDFRGGYFFAETFIVSQGIIALYFCFWLNVIDRRTDRMLNYKTMSKK